MRRRDRAPRIARIVLAGLFFWPWCMSAPAQHERIVESVPPPEIIEHTGPPDELGRIEMAIVYQRIERALIDHPPAESRVAEFNRRFDRATGFFFSGRTRQATNLLCQMCFELMFPGVMSSEQNFAASIIARPTPRIVARDAGLPLELTLDWLTLAPPAGSAPQRVMLRVLSQHGAVMYETALKSLMPDGGRLRALQWPADAMRLWPGGVYDILLSDGNGASFRAGRFAVIDEQLDDIRAAYEARLQRLILTDESLRGAAQTLAARIRLLTDARSDISLTLNLQDVPQLIRTLDIELAHLEAGEDPYRGTLGDTWRPIPVQGGMLPMRCYAPPQAADRALPLVIAFHGAGGDENLFLSGYGAGLIKRLADDRGFLVAAPSTYPFATRPLLLDDVIDAMSRDYRVDQSRIYVLGHSLGGMVTSSIAQVRSDRIAAAACIAGVGSIDPDKSVPPMLVISAEFDGMVPKERIERLTDAARAAGRPIEYRMAHDQGHTLIVNAMLDQIIDWLLQHHSEPN